MSDPVLEDLRRHPELHRALRQLRHKALLTQEQLAALVSGKGQKVSAVFLRKCEAENEKTRRYPSAEMLTAILDALSSSPVELYLLLNELVSNPAPSAATDSSRYRITETTQRYVTPSTPTAQTLAKVDPASSAAYASSFDATRSLRMGGGVQAKSMLRSAAPAALPEMTAVNAAFAAMPLAAGDSVDPRTEAIRGEIWNGVPELSMNDQNTLLGVYRSLRSRTK